MIQQQQNRRVTRSGKYGGSHTSSPGGPGGSVSGKNKSDFGFYRLYYGFVQKLRHLMKK